MGERSHGGNAAGVAWLSTSGGGSDCVGRSGLEKPTQAGGESVRARESARAFLTVSNSRLKFWCRVADLDMNTILRTYCQGGKVARIVGDVEPDPFDDFVKKPLLTVP